MTDKHTLTQMLHDFVSGTACALCPLATD